MANLKISELIQRTPDGTEFLEVIIPPFSPGSNRKVLLSELLSLAAGGVSSVNGETGAVTGFAKLASPALTGTPTVPTAAANTNTTQVASTAFVQQEMRKTRTVTGADSLVQGDDNSLIIFNSASPFNFTLDQLTASSKISFLNIGAGDVTMVPGSGVTISGSLVIDGAVGNLFPAAMIFYHTATTPRVFYGASDTIDLSTVSTAGGTITLDYALKQQRVFEGSASFGTAKAIVEDNETNARAGEASFNLTNIAAVLTFPSDFAMPIADSRWNNGAKTFTPETTGIHVFTWIKYSSYTAMLVPNVFP